MPSMKETYFKVKAYKEKNAVSMSAAARHFKVDPQDMYKAKYIYDRTSVKKHSPKKVGRTSKKPAEVLSFEVAEPQLDETVAVIVTKRSNISKVLADIWK